MKQSLKLQAALQDSKIYLTAVAEILARKLLASQFATQTAAPEDKFYKANKKSLKK